jgi:polyhydroxyalkanoate synthesis regulator phasin
MYAAAAARALPAGESIAATPEDMESGDFEIKCSTNCAFVRSGAIMGTLQGGVGEAALKAAEDLAESQEKLKATQDALRADPQNQALQTQEIVQQSEVNEMTAALQAAVGGGAPEIDLEGTAAALAGAKKNVEDLTKEAEANPSPEASAKLDIAKAEVRKLQAHLEAKQHGGADLDAEISRLNARLHELKGALAADPEDGEVQQQVAEVEAALAEKSKDAGGFMPKRECYRVCMNPHNPGAEPAPTPDAAAFVETGSEMFMGLGDINNCIRMCVKVMRHLVYNIASDQ